MAFIICRTGLGSPQKSQVPLGYRNKRFSFLSFVGITLVSQTFQLEVQHGFLPKTQKQHSNTRALVAAYDNIHIICFWEVKELRQEVKNWPHMAS